MGPILVLDDDEELLSLLRRVLQSEGYRVLTATSSAEALRRARTEEPSLIIADLMLPHVDGEAFLGQYRRLAPDSTCPVVLLTASAQRREVARRMNARATLAKPFSLDELRGLVRELLSGDKGADRQHDASGDEGQ